MKKKTDQIKLLELLSQQLLFAAEKLNESDTDSDHEALIDQLGTYGQMCPDCEGIEGLQEASDDWVFHFVWSIAHNKELLGLFLHCAYSHHSKRDVDNLFRQKEREFCESADEEEMHFHLTGEHYEDCDCPKCDVAEEVSELPDDECMCDECCEERIASGLTSESGAAELLRRTMDAQGPVDKEVWDAAYAKVWSTSDTTTKAA